MSLVLAVVGLDAIVVAADGLAITVDTSGMPASLLNAQKMFPLSPGCMLMSTGFVELAIPTGVDKKSRTCEEWAYALSERAGDHWRAISARHIERIPPLGAAVVGYTDRSLPTMFTFNSSVNFVVSPAPNCGFIALGAMSLSHYLLRRLYHSDLRCAEAAELAVYCLEETSFQTPHIGGDFAVAIVRPQQAIEFLSSDIIVSMRTQARSFAEYTRDAMHRGVTRSQGHRTNEASLPNVDKHQ